ncbi:MAG: M43 family zinc metalloprotease [Flavobacterium haoranii]
MKKLLLSSLLFVFALGYSQTKTKSLTQIKSSDSFEEEITKARAFMPNGIVRCASTEYNNDKKRNGRAVSDKVFEEWIAPKIEEVKRLREQGRLTTITIPVVVHVIHNGDAIGSGENISDAQVLSQIQVFNEDFGKIIGTPGYGAGVDTGIQFCLAQVDPNGNPTNGIDRVQRTTTAYSTRTAIETAKAATIWDPTKYLNCWTFRFGGSMSTVLGYAQFPTGSGLAGMPSGECIDDQGSGASTDGVVCNYNTWGSSSYASGSFNAPYDKGRTMTHEVGHMLGLRHIWGDGDCSVDDYCADTPLAADANFGCPTLDSCTSDPGNDQVQNYMDYSDDTCMNMFTQDQADRMWAVLLNSPRRDDLLQSNVCSATPNTPYIQFKRVPCESRLPDSGIEGNGCSYTEYTIPLNITKAPSSDAVVTFAVDGASEADIYDVQIMTPTVTFNAGSTADKNLVFRVLNDGYFESDEELLISFTVLTSGDAIANLEGDTFSFKIENDDEVTTVGGITTLFFDDFSDGDSNGWTILDGNNETADDWFIAQESNWTPSFGIYTDYFMASYSWNGVDYTPDNFLSTPAIQIPSSATNINLNYFAGSGSDPDYYSENYQVYISTAIGNVSTITGGTLLTTTVIPAVGGAYYNLTIPNSFAGQTVYITFRHYNTSGQWLLGIDEVEVSADVTTSVQTAVDNATAGQNSLKGIGITGFKDSSSANIIADVTVNENVDFGCTNGYVSAAGTGAVQYGSSSNTTDYRMSKQFTITPANVLTNGATIKFYFTEAEIAGWESATGNTRSQLYVERVGSTTEAKPVSLGAFGSDVTLTATFTNGIEGIYSFASQNYLKENNYEISDVSIYPNPNNGSFNIQMNLLEENTSIKVFDIRGRLMVDRKVNATGLVNEVVNLQSAQSGIYLVTIENGSKKVTKKIVVE